MLSQQTAYALAAALLAGAAAPLLIAPASGRKLLQWLLYSKNAALVLFAPAIAWFAFHLWHLSDADFGQFRMQLFGIAVVAGIASFFVIPEFLAVRGLAGLTLLFAQYTLDQSWMNYDPVLVWCGKTTFYAAILAAIYYGTVPYKLRHHDEWMAAQPGRHRALGAILALGSILLIAAATRPVIA